MAYDDQESQTQPIHFGSPVLVERNSVAGYLGDGDAGGKFFADSGVLERAALGIANQRFVIPALSHDSGDERESGRSFRLSPAQRSKQVVVYDDLIEIRRG